MQRILVQITALIAIMLSVCCMELKFKKETISTNPLLEFKKKNPTEFAALSCQLAKHKSELEVGATRKGFSRKLLLGKMRSRVTPLPTES